MAREARRILTEPEALTALAHPVRLALLEHLMSDGPATASAAGRAVGDSPSNCSYHLRALAAAGLVERTASADGRERPWRALVTGFDTGPDEPGTPGGDAAAALWAVALQHDQRRMREYLARRDRVPPRWRRADANATYALRMSPAELAGLRDALDALIRPYIAPTREDAPRDAEVVHLTLQAYPRDLP